MKNEKKILTQNIQEIQDTMRRPNLRIIGVDENEDEANIFNKIIEENFPNLKVGLGFYTRAVAVFPNPTDYSRET